MKSTAGCGTGVWVLACLCLAGCAPGVPDDLAPDLILHSGKIVTVDDGFSIAQAVAIRDGKIVAVGSDSGILALAGTSSEQLDLEGRTVLPGFYDSHLHLAWPVGEAPNPAIRELGASSSIPEIVEIVRGEVERARPGEVVYLPGGPALVGGIREGRWPDRQDLDPVSPGNPVILAFAADGVYVTNSRGLELAGLDQRTPQPYRQGLMGELEVDPRTGRLTGVMRGRSAAHLLVVNRREGVPARINLMIRIPVRALSSEECIDLIRGLLFAPPLQNDYLRVGTFKFSLDKGYPGAEPYVVPAEKGKRVLIEAHRAGWQLYVHITTPETFEYAVEALREALRLYPREDHRHIFTHIWQPTRENIQAMKEMGIVADLQVNHIYHYADDLEETYRVDPGRPDFGPRPVGTYRDAGIPILLSSDQAPVGPLFSVGEAVNRVRRSGKVFQPRERLTREEAIRAVTATPAWAFSQEGDRGSIEAGKFADLVVLGRDILSVDPMEIKDIPVLRTMTGGRFVYVNPDQSPHQEVRYLRYPARTAFLE